MYTSEDTGPRKLKGHITVFPSNVQELSSRRCCILSCKLWTRSTSHGTVRRSLHQTTYKLLAVRRRVVERAPVWLKENNPHYANIEIDTAEMESWENATHGVPSLVYDRLQRNEPFAGVKRGRGKICRPQSGQWMTREARRDRSSESFE